jgi:hypothetical protein
VHQLVSKKLWGLYASPDLTVNRTPHFANTDFWCGRVKEAVFCVECKGRIIVQAESVSDSNSEGRNRNEEIVPVNRLTQTVCTDQPAPATTTITLTDKQRTFFAPTGAASRNQSWNLICLHCRLAPTLGIWVGTWICLHYTRTVSVVRKVSYLLSYKWYNELIKWWCGLQVSQVSVCLSHFTCILLYNLKVTYFNLCLFINHVIIGSLSPRHGASSGWGRRNGLRYGGQLRIYWISCRGQPTRGGPPAWGLGKVLTTPPRQNPMLNNTHKLRYFLSRKNNPEINYSLDRISGGGGVFLEEVSRSRQRKRDIFRR